VRVVQHQIHRRSIYTEEGNTDERIFIDGNGLIRAIALLVLADYREKKEGDDADDEIVKNVSTAT